ncbi:MAG TPA: SWIM zinc finger family protein, partial [Dehalococcoidia bacterium]|nr:SWIM zinc finger family protein [Dehalococcoidia bacterium]
MRALLNLSEATIRQYASQESFQRGRDYYEEGAVLSVTRRGNQLLAAVQGSEYLPYRVRITLGPDTLAQATCSCPYDWGGYCKHVIAALLTFIHQPEQVEERLTIEAILAQLDRAQLQTLLLKLVEQQPEVADRLENLVATLGIASQGEASAEPTSGAAPTPRRPTRVNPTAIRRQVQTILHGLDYMRPSEAYWHVGSVVNELRQVLGQARVALEAGDGDNALVILEVLTEEYLAGWEMLDDSNGEASGLFGELGQLWAEVILSVELTSSQRKQWAQRLAHWQEEVNQYGVDEAFDGAQAAAKQGWDYPPLRRVLQGEISNRGAWVGEVPGYADELTQARLRVLERQGRTQEYLYLAQAEGQREQCVTMLVKLGRVPEAVEYGLNHLVAAEETLVLAQALAEGKEIALALEIGEHGLALEGHKTSLARFLRSLATSSGQSDLALRAALAAFRESLDL